MRQLDIEVESLKARVKQLEAALHRISLGSQNSGTTKEDLGRDARSALEGVHTAHTPDRIARLEVALKPFAECARVFDPDMVGGTMPRTGEWQSWPRMVDGKMHTYTLTVEHLREARDVLVKA